MGYLATDQALQHDELNASEWYPFSRNEVDQHVSRRFVHRSQPHCEYPLPFGVVELQLMNDRQGVVAEVSFSWVCKANQWTNSLDGLNLQEVRTSIFGKAPQKGAYPSLAMQMTLVQ